MISAEASIVPPSKALLLLEAPRALAELGLVGPLWPLLRAAPRGDGHPVLVLPGMAASDSSTSVLRLFLRKRGFAAYRWKQGRNTGSRAVIETLAQRISDLQYRHGAKVSLVGISLGGIYARELAKLVPDAVRCVVTLGSAFRGPHRASNAWRVYEYLSGDKAGDLAHDAFTSPTPVPATAVFTGSDGVVAWRRCLERPGPLAESIEVIGSHSGLGHNALALYAVADRLAQPEDRWQPFRAPRALRLLYREP